MDIFFTENLSWLSIILRLTLSLIAGMLIGLERKLSNHPTGMKTHALVCIGSTLVSMIAVEMGYTAFALAGEAKMTVDISRIAAGVVTGIGFIGAGAIMKSKDGVIVTGLTTAATLWVTACLGLAIGMGYLKMSAVALVSVFVANTLLRYLEIKLHLSTKNTKGIVISSTDKTEAVDFLEKLFKKNKVFIDNFELTGKSESAESPGKTVYHFRYTVKLPRAAQFDVLMRNIALNETIVQVYETIPTAAKESQG